MGDLIADVVKFKPKKKDRTAAERMRRLRERKRNEERNQRTPSVTAAVTGRTVTAVTLAAALGMAGVSALMSVTGLTAIFAGAVLPVMAMGVTLEFGKLTAAWHVSAGYAIGWLRWAGLVTVVGALMLLNSIGVNGFLSRAHLRDAAPQYDNTVDIRISTQKAELADLDKNLAQIDDVVAEAVRRGRTAGAMAFANAPQRNQLRQERKIAASALIALEIQKQNEVNQRNVTLAEHLGPVGYLSSILGTSTDQTMRWFILAVSLLLDPAAVLLVGAAAAHRRSLVRSPA